MIGNDGIKMAIKDDLHGIDFNRITTALEDVIDAFGWAVFPSVYLTMIAGFVKTVGM